MSETPHRSEGVRLALAGVFLVVCLASLDHNMVATALPQVAADLGGLGQVSWIVTAFLLPATVTMPLYGKLSDVFGRRRVLAFAVITFVVGSVLCAASQTMLQLIAFRAIQGLGAGGLFTLALTILADLAPPTQRARYQAIVVSAAAICQFLGPLAGGILTEYGSWRWVFLINPPVGVIALLMIWRGIAPRATRGAAQLDFMGAATLIITASAFLFALAALAEPAWRTLAAPSLAVAAAGAAAFTAVERRASDPILPFDIFRRPSYALGVSAFAAMTFAMYATMSFAPLFLQNALGLTPSQSGTAILAQVFGMVCASAIATRWRAAAENLKAAAMTGVGAEIIGIGGLAACAVLGWGVEAVIACLMIRGLGMGAAVPMVTTIVQNAIGGHQLGAATSAMMFVRSMGGVIGVAVAGMVIALLFEQGAGVAFGAIFALNALLMCAAFALLRALPASPTRPPQPPSPGAASPIDPLH